MSERDRVAAASEFDRVVVGLVALARRAGGRVELVVKKDGTITLGVYDEANRLIDRRPADTRAGAELPAPSAVLAAFADQVRRGRA